MKVSCNDEIYAEEHQLNLCRRASTKSMPKSINEVYAEEHQRNLCRRASTKSMPKSINELCAEEQSCEAENIDHDSAVKLRISTVS